MEALKRKILAEGQAIGDEIVKVDSFLNHQIDAEFMYDMGAEFKRRFEGEAITKILTIEASGIAIAVCTAKFFGYPPVIFAKKDAPDHSDMDIYSASAKSFTKNITSHVRIAKKFLSCEDRVLIIDDFLAHGESALALCDLVRQAGGTVAGVGAVIEMEFNGGSARLAGSGYRVESLAVIERIEDGRIVFNPPL